MATELRERTEAFYDLPADAIACFRRDGHVLLPQVFTAEDVETFRTAIREASFAANTEKRPLADRDAFGKAFLQTQNLRLRDPIVERLVLSPRLGRIAAELMGVEGVRIFHDQSLFKEPGGGINPTPWHQDQYYWPLAESTTLGLWMPLMNIEADMGGMLHASGTHRLGFLGQHEISDESQRVYGAMIEAENIPVVASVPMRAGDISFHYGWTLHAAGANFSNTLREAMIVTYFADGMRVAQPSNPHQEHDRIKFLGGREPGAIADSPLNPLVYQALRS
ncbi:phytanoyl-CoA dioxygenase family protein [Sandaracinobacteroides saxicola]|uniref:Phytanoyl-CoA dioxygenase family protein n=1 Tax=Sandaracinobacteroides saxicola TaxID=2759707 RepID=A0A7G5IM26_9SPHN|nr:phytanoyl-CoA dioxygenase family protein [Sandaracinobacteroides saxicola]QMW24418.1 phytanoyl-CoA dioxygenase family protein [Sandaracinobacteroides saxicola]